jgi:4a-hydroxytetrahydrobiopterin dehydratase
MTLLSDDEIQAAVAELPGWAGGTAAIAKEYRLADFRAAVAFVVRLSYDAEAANHHPDLDIRYNRVRVALSTHSEGGVTAKDVDLASAIERLGAAATV